jgi:hypothetical protein
LVAVGAAAHLASAGGRFVKSILDRSFRYTNSVETDLRKTFARIRREQRAREQAVAAAEADSLNKIRPFRQKAH